MKAFSYVDKTLRECNFDQRAAGEQIKNSLVRLRKNYDGVRLEKIITMIIKEEIFAYVFYPEHTPPRGISKNQAEWIALTSSQASIIIGNLDQKHALSQWQREYYFDIDQLWVVKHEADELLAPFELKKDTQSLITITEISKPSIEPTIQSPAKPSRKTAKRVIFDGFINHLIDYGYTKKIFRDEMKNTYFIVKEKLSDCEKFNHYDKVVNIYTTQAKAGKNDLLHFSFTNAAGEAKPQKPYSLGTVDNIFDEVMALRKK